MKKNLIVIPIMLLGVSPANSASLIGNDELSCLCSDGTIVAAGKRCPDRTICGGSTPNLYIDCAAGYWGQSTDGITGCSPCPTWSGVYIDAAHTITVAGATGNVGAYYITGCSIPAGTYYDATGTFTLTSNCAYSN